MLCAGYEQSCSGNNEKTIIATSFDEAIADLKATAADMVFGSRQQAMLFA